MEKRKGMGEHLMASRRSLRNTPTATNGFAAVSRSRRTKVIKETTLIWHLEFWEHCYGWGIRRDRLDTYYWGSICWDLAAFETLIPSLTLFTNDTLVWDRQLWTDNFDRGRQALELGGRC